MVIIRKFKDEDILKILIERASDSLPNESKGILEARFNKDDSVDVFFIENKTTSVPS